MADFEFRVDGNVAIMTFNRPQAKNALNGAIAKGMTEAFAEIASNADIRVGVMTGAGGSFCSGMDLKAFAAGEAMDFTGVPMGRKENPALEKPIIAAVEGFALAGGFEMALLCDIIVASETAKFGVPEVKRGLVAAGGGLFRLARQLPMRIATELVLTGDIVDAALMHHHGAVNHLTPEGGALDKALEIARKIAANGPMAVRVSRQVMQLAADWPLAESADLQTPYVEPVFQSADAREGAVAFAEKREPKWTGR